MSHPRNLASWIIPGLLWLWVFWHLHDEWSLNPNYNYGWAVPFLAAFLFYLRWIDRPEVVAISATERIWGRTTRWLLLASLLPIRIVEGANPDWRLLGWIMALIAVAYSLLLIRECGGPSWMRHFIFPVCFPLVAVPWLAQFENAVVQSLARVVAAVAVEIVGWLGVPAFRLGNVIELPSGLVGVDDACSGVKTLQAAIMVTLFLGELLRLRPARRLLLLVVGCVWVFLGNTARATTLVALAARRGIEAVGSWHDIIGTIVLLIGIGGLAVMAFLLREKGTESVAKPKATAARPASPVIVCFGVAWLITVFLITELWYRRYEQGLLNLPAWSVDWPNGNRVVPIDDSTRTILRYDDASSATWRDSTGHRWWGFFARWEPKRTALQLVRSHSPEICLPATGRIFKRELPIVRINDFGLGLRFRVFEFEQNNRPLFVYVAIKEDKAVGVAESRSLEWNTRGRVNAAWQGKRNLGQRLLELAVTGPADAAEADAAAKRIVRELLKLG